MIIHKFGMCQNIMHFNLAGMGCSAGLIAIDLASKMLQVHSNMYALVVSTENITQNWYFGNQRSMLIPNCLFRMGCSATVLSNKYVDGWRAKYALQCPVVRTITGGSNDDAYRCIYQMEDEFGNKVRLPVAPCGHCMATIDCQSAISCWFHLLECGRVVKPCAARLDCAACCSAAASAHALITCSCYLVQCSTDICNLDPATTMCCKNLRIVGAPATAESSSRTRRASSSASSSWARPAARSRRTSPRSAP